MAIDKRSLLGDPKVPWLGQALKPVADRHDLLVEIESMQTMSIVHDGYMLSFRIRDKALPDSLAVYSIRLKGYYKALVEGMPKIADHLKAKVSVRDLEGRNVLFQTLPLTLENLLQSTVDLGDVHIPTKRVVLMLTTNHFFADHDLQNA